MTSTMGSDSDSNELFHRIIISIATIIYFVGHWNIIRHGYVYPAGDHIVGFFSNYVVMESLLDDFSFPLWNPYLNHGAIDYWATLVFHPLITIWGIFGSWINNTLNLGVSTYGILYLGFMILYFIGVGVACYFISLEFSTRKSVALVCLILALFGPHLYQTIRAMQYNTLFFPYAFMYFIRIFINQKITRYNFYGLLLSTGLLLSQAFGWIGHILTLFVLSFFACFIAYGIDHIRISFKNMLGLVRRAPFGFVVCFLICFGMGLSKIIFFLRKDNIVFNSYVKISPIAYYIELVTSHFKSLYLSFVKGPYFESTSISNYISENQTNFINNSNLFDLARSMVEFNPMTLDPFYVGVTLAGVCLLGLSKKIARPQVFLIILLAILVCLCSANSPRFVKYLIAMLNPSFTLGTRHINYLLLFSTPIVCALVAACLDAFYDQLDRGLRVSFKQMFFIVIFIVAPSVVFNLESWRIGYLSSILVIFLVLSRSSKIMIKIKNLTQPLIVFIVLLDLVPIFLSIQKQVFQSFSTTKLYDQYGMVNYPQMFNHNFSYFFGTKKEILNDAIAHPNNNLPYLKAYTGEPALNAYMNFAKNTDEILSGSPDLPKVFITSTVMGSSNENFNTSLQSLVERGFPGNVVLIPNFDSSFVILKKAGLVRKYGELPQEPLGWEQSVQRFELNGFNHQYRFDSLSSLNSVQFNLPALFPKYWSSNIFNIDSSFSSLNSSGATPFYPTFFNIAQSDHFQIGFPTNRELKIWSKDVAKLNFPLSIEFKIPKASQGIEVRRFTFNEAEFEFTSVGQQLFVYMDRFHPYWRVLVDGLEEPIVSAYGQFKAVFLQPGEHDIKFEFKDSILTAALCLYMLFTPTAWFFVVWGLNLKEGMLSA